jgi:hypothetical protein
MPGHSPAAADGVEYAAGQYSIGAEERLRREQVGDKRPKQIEDGKHRVE